MKKITFLFLVLTSIGKLNGQEGRLADFSVVKLDNINIEVRWVMKAGVSCLSPEVQNSYDGVEFSSIYRYPGVCGGGAEEESFRWIHSNANSSKKSYYRLKIDEGEFSTIEFVERGLNFENSKIIVYPNPVDDRCTISFEEDLGKIAAIEFYNAEGKEVSNPRVNWVKRNSNSIDIELNDLESGLYFVRLIFQNGKRSSVKLLVD